MNLQDYPTPSDQPSQPTASQWFNSLPSDTPPPVPEPDNTPEPKSKKMIIIAISLIAVIVLGSAAAIFASQASAARCLTTEDYKALTGIDFEDTSTFSPTDTFFTSSVVFENGSAKFIEGSEEPFRAQSKKLGAFYTERAESQPMTITVSADYTENDTKEAASQRIGLLVRQLEASGVDSTAIKQAAPQQIITGGELSSDSAELALATAYISVASPATCR